MIWKYIKADSFFRDYLPNIKNYKRKISGKSGKGQPLEFSSTEKKEIKAAIVRLLKNIRLL